MDSQGRAAWKRATGAYCAPPVSLEPATAAAVAVPAPLAAPAARARLSTGALLILLTGAALLPRALLFPLNENFYGDAVMRTELAERWLAHPRWIASFTDGAFQFGPAHLYALAAALKVIPAREHAGRAVSLLFGTLTVLPLFFLSRRLFGRAAAIAACGGFALWGMHLQMSTTAASEAFSLFWVLAALAAFVRGAQQLRAGPLAVAAACLNVACATRYDAWMLVPLLSATLALGAGPRRERLEHALLFGLLCAPFPLVWMFGNWRMTGDPLFPIHYIDAFHRAWWPQGAALFGETAYRLQNAVFWPWVALLTLSPLVAALGMFGLGRAWRAHPQSRWLISLVLLPTAFFTLRSAVLATFVPLGRFAALQLLLLLPFVWVGVEGLRARLSQRVVRAVVWAAALVAVALPVGLGAFTFRREGKYEDWLRPVSPTSTNPPALMDAARWVKAEVAASGGALILDSDAQYRDLQLAFFGGLPESRMARHRWDDFPALLKSARPRYLALFEEGSLVEEGKVTLTGARAELDGEVFVELPGPPGPVRLFAKP